MKENLSREIYMGTLGKSRPRSLFTVRHAAGGRDEGEGKGEGKGREEGKAE